MSRCRSYIWLWVTVLPLVITSCSGCKSRKKKELNQLITLWRRDKIPYGSFVAYECLPYMFPAAEITINRTSPTRLDGSEGKKAYIILAPFLDPDEGEVNALLNLAGEGNHVFISAFAFGDSLLHSLHLAQGNKGIFMPANDTLRVSVYHPVSFDSLTFTYPGQAYDGWISSLDSQYASVLGRDRKGRPDFIKFSYKGGGSLCIQLAPLAFSNFFLLHKDNKAYYENAFSHIPASVHEVIWDEYFRYGRKKSFSALRYIFSNDSLEWAFWLILLLFLLVYLVESKRKQRIVPLISGLRNNSLDFVKTIGQLYYQRRDNLNLALKMSAHFYDHIRTRYNLVWNDPEIVTKLAYRTGIPKESLEDLWKDINILQEAPALSDEQLLAFSRKLEEFYQHT